MLGTDIGNHLIDASNPVCVKTNQTTFVIHANKYDTATCIEKRNNLSRQRIRARHVNLKLVTTILSALRNFLQFVFVHVCV